MTADLWIALAHVKPKARKSILPKKAKGSFVNVLGIAKDVDELERRIRQAVEADGLELVELEDVEKFDERIENYDVSTELWNLADSMRNSGDLRFGTFHNYLAEDEIQ
jgi:hypothetical protein